MKILIVGGTGLIGGHAAIYLKEQGNEVWLAARKAPAAESPLANFDVLLGDYTQDEFSLSNLAGFDALIFAAAQDLRHLPKEGFKEGADESAHWESVNSQAVPRFFALAREAGVKKAVYIGSFYPQVTPKLIESVPYIKSRHLADVGVRELATPNFSVCSVNAPFVVGVVPGLANPMFRAYTRYAQGKMEGLAVYGPAGGTNFISTQSLSEAIWGALQQGEAGKAYLVGDENLSFADYFGAFFRAAGNSEPVPALDQEHPLLPDSAIYPGRGNVVAYEPDPEETALLGYRRGDIQRAVDEIVAEYAEA